MIDLHTPNMSAMDPNLDEESIEDLPDLTSHMNTLDLKMDRENMDDLTDLEILNEDTVVEALKSRFVKNLVFTCIADILLYINPLTELDIYNDNLSKQYKNTSHSCKPPAHLYSISSQIFRSFCNTGDSQCCIVTGNSGSGKTEAVKRLINHMTMLCMVDNTQLGEKLIKANPLLEAFGNAKTGLNLNSSRFGQYLEMHCLPNGCITGGWISEYLLESSRLCDQVQGERNFHIFYYMFAGMSHDGLAKFFLDSPSSHR